MAKIREMKPIEIKAAESIAKKYGYDQVIIYGRRVGESPNPHGEHLTTYGINPDHCKSAADIGNHLKFSVFKWEKEYETE